MFCCTGVTPNIISVAFFDILNLMLWFSEIIYKFSEKFCAIYLGFECVINIYIFNATILTNLQVISTLSEMKKHFKINDCSNEVLFETFDVIDKLDDQEYQIVGN